MDEGPARASSSWLALREPADAGARSGELVEELRAHVPQHDLVVVHDLGCGTGSMARWLAARLAGPQHWVLVDRDEELLALAADSVPPLAADGAPVTAQTRQQDITRLEPQDVQGADLITASALLDMMTADELRRFVATCAGAGCPALVALSVTGRVDLLPADPLDRRVGEAFNAHQRRDVAGVRLLGPDAARLAASSFRGLGLDVLVRATPWRLGAEHRALQAQWFTGWLGAACEQDPSLVAETATYGRRRLAQAASGRLHVTVHHEDLLVRPP